MDWLRNELTYTKHNIVDGDERTKYVARNTRTKNIGRSGKLYFEERENVASGASERKRVQMWHLKKRKRHTQQRESERGRECISIAVACSLVEYSNMQWLLHFIPFIRSLLHQQKQKRQQQYWPHDTVFFGFPFFTQFFPNFLFRHFFACGSGAEESFFW